jgi:Macrocin-O-methyltransferase (TylF)
VISSRTRTRPSWPVVLVLAACLTAPLLLVEGKSASEAVGDQAPAVRATRAAARRLGPTQRRALAHGIGIARRLRLTAVLHRVIHRLPTRVADRLDNARRNVRMRAGEPVPAAEGGELEPAFLRMLQLLTARHEGGSDAIGDYLEFGVYIGTSLTAMHRALDCLGLDQVRLFGFDSFEGLPEAARYEENGYWRAGMYRADIELTRERLTEAGVRWDRTKLVKGWFDETLTRELADEHRIERASVVMVDCDLYSSTEAVLRFCEPLLADEAIVIMDDYRAGDDECPRDGERRAFTEFLARHPQFEAVELPELAYSRTSAVFLVTRSGERARGALAA